MDSITTPTVISNSRVIRGLLYILLALAGALYTTFTHRVSVINVRK